VIAEAAEEYERLVMAVVRAAETEGALRRVADGVGRTRRKVDALEKRVIPDLIAARDRIIAPAGRARTGRVLAPLLDQEAEGLKDERRR